jgi:hypothetical protein
MSTPRRKPAPPPLLRKVERLYRLLECGDLVLALDEARRIHAHVDSLEWEARIERERAARKP